MIRYERILIDDEQNPDGVVRIHRAFAAQGWRGSVNVGDEYSIGWQDSGQVIVGRTGSESVTQGYKARHLTITFPYLPKDETLSNVFEQARRDGKTSHVYISLMPLDKANLHRFSFLARIDDNLSFRNRLDQAFQFTMNFQEVMG